ncbi:MAG: hypothetical protein RL204_1300 [Bacteroidota bacterium]|jgi:hypothetical protein
MKKQLAMLFVVAIAVALTSCGGGWTDENKKETKELCTSLQSIIYPDDAASICDCYVNKLVAGYPKADFTPEQSSALLEECSADAKKKAEEAADKKFDEMMNDAGMEGGATEGTTAPAAE